ncbi:MAG TPA: YncE family protein, partial [Solirubrobacteraceae bacterium]|nr:YncE family protein [Solirubrobacteraceae bacterium]
MSARAPRPASSASGDARRAHKHARGARPALGAVTACALAIALAACGGGASGSRGGESPAGAGARGANAVPRAGRVPPALNRVNVYAADRAGALSPVVRRDPPLVYVPNSESNTVDVISQRTFKVINSFPVGTLPQHVVPAWNLRTLYVTNDLGNSLTPIDPRTGRPGRPIPVSDPYNMYFTADGRWAVVVSEARRELDFRDARTM